MVIGVCDTVGITGMKGLGLAGQPALDGPATAATTATATAAAAAAEQLVGWGLKSPTDELLTPLLRLLPGGLVKP